MIMKKVALVAACMLALSREGHSTLPVVDYSHIAQDAAHQVVNLAKYAITATKETETALNTLKTYENTVLQVARFGNPAALQSIPGLSTISELYGAGQQLMQDYQQWKQLFNPRRYQNDFNYILGTYQQPQWNGFTTASGFNLAPNQGLYQWDTARYNIASSAQDELKQLEEQRQRLEKKRDEVLNLPVTTASEVQRYHMALDGVNGALAEVGARENQVAHQVRLKNQQIGAGQEIYRASQFERQRAANLQSLDTDLMALPLNGVHQPINWGGSTP
jgi:hypothetical protein